MNETNFIKLQEMNDENLKNVTSLMSTQIYTKLSHFCMELEEQESNQPPSQVLYKNRDNETVPQVSPKTRKKAKKNKKKV